MDTIFSDYRSYISIILAASAFSADARSGAFFTVTPNGSELNISTTVPNHHYPIVGLQIPSNCLIGTSLCTSQANQTCVFPISAGQTQSIALQCPQGQSVIDVTLCLNGPAHLSCQHFYPNINTQMLVGAQIGPNNTGSTEQAAVYLGNATSWNNPIVLDVAAGATVNSIWCSDSKSLCVLSGKTPSDGFVFTSSDAGNTWTPVTSVTNPTVPASRIVSISCSANGMICTGVGQSSTVAGVSPEIAQNLLYTTNNGGASWSGPVILTGISSSTQNVLQSVACTSNGSICTTVGRGNVTINSVGYSYPFSYTSYNAGVSWSGPVSFPTPAPYVSADLRVIGGAR